MGLIDEQLQQNRGCYFPLASYASLGFSLVSDNQIIMVYNPTPTKQ